MRGKMFTRRRFMAASAAASTTMIAAPFVKTAHAAGKLSIGFWDHFVPDANKTSDALIQEWAAKEKVEVQIDRFTGNKALITLAAEAQARSGHDILYMTSWLPHAYAAQAFCRCCAHCIQNCMGFIADALAFGQLPVGLMPGTPPRPSRTRRTERG